MNHVPVKTDLFQNTLVYTSIYGVHFDKKIWGDPEVFRPERFINSEGKLVKKDYSIPFGAGKLNNMSIKANII